MVKWAIEESIDVNVKLAKTHPHPGWMPLHEACKNGHETIVSLLLEKGADVNAKDD